MQAIQYCLNPPMLFTYGRYHAARVQLATWVADTGIWTPLKESKNLKKTTFQTEKYVFSY